jgi:hypothetical protein
MMAIFKSRKAVIGMFALVFYLLIAAFPQTRPIAEVVAGPLVALVGVTVLGIAAEDSVRLWAERPADASKAATDVVEVIMEELMRILDERQQQHPVVTEAEQPVVVIKEGDELPPADG